MDPLTAGLAIALLMIVVIFFTRKRPPRLYYEIDKSKRGRFRWELLARKAPGVYVSVAVKSGGGFLVREQCERHVTDHFPQARPLDREK